MEQVAVPQKRSRLSSTHEANDQVSHADARAILDRFPLLPTERHAVAAAQSAEVLDDVREQYGDRIAALLGTLVFGQAPVDDHIRNAAELFRKETITLQATQDVRYAGENGRGSTKRNGQKRQAQAHDDMESAVDAQTALLLADDNEEVRARAEQLLRGLRWEIRKSVVSNGMDITQPGVAGLHESKMQKVTVSDTLDPARVADRYMASTPGIVDTIDGLVKTKDPTYGDRARELKGRRTQAFALYQEIMKDPNIVSMHRDDLDNILETCFLLCSGRACSLTLSIGLGGTEKDPSTRLPSYIIPSLRLMRVFKRYRAEDTMKQMPTLRLLYAGHAASTVNKMNAEEVHEAGRKLRYVLQEFIREYAPDIQDHVKLVSDKPLSVPTYGDTEEVMELVELDDGAKAWIDKKTKQMMEEGRIEGPFETAKKRVLQYIACHPLLMKDVLSGRWHENHPATSPEIAISLGGNMEGVYNYYRREITAALHRTEDPQYYFPLSSRLVQSQGKHVPYAPIPNVDVPVRDMTDDGDVLLNTDAVMRRQGEKPDKAIAKNIAGDYTAIEDFVRESMDQGHIANCNTSRGAIDNHLRRFYLRTGQGLANGQLAKMRI